MAKLSPTFVLGPEIPHCGCLVPGGAAYKFKLGVQTQISTVRCSWGRRQSADSTIILHADNVPKRKHVANAVSGCCEGLGLWREGSQVPEVSMS